MFLTIQRSGYDRGEPVASGRFLLLVQPFNQLKPIRALVRFAAMRQMGNWMMGQCRAYGHRVPLCGAYGNDGLPRAVPKVVYDHAIPVPDALIQAWNEGGGWNDAGREGPAMREWAIKTFKL